MDLSQAAMTNAASFTEAPRYEAPAWEPRRQSTLEAARRRSRRLSVLRIGFVAAASASFSAFFGFMTLHALLGGFSARDEVEVSEALRMINPRFTGRSAEGQPFIVQAASATRRAPGSDLIELERPVYETEGRRVSAEAGVYHQSDESIDLSGDVVLTDAQGNTFSSSGAVVSGAEDVVTGQHAIRGAGPLGSVRADSYEVRDGGDRIILRGRVQGVVNQSPRRNAS